MKSFLILMLTLTFVGLTSLAFAGTPSPTAQSASVISPAPTGSSPAATVPHTSWNPFKGMADTNIILFIVSIFIPIISFCKIFVDAGREWWEAIIPIYNLYVWTQIIDVPAWHLIFMLIPIVNIFALFSWWIKLAKKRGKSAGFGWGLALLFPFFGAWLAWMS